MGIKSKIEEKAMGLQSTLAGQAQMDFLKYVMKEEECDYEMAFAICSGNTDPIEYEYMLGFKLADPVLQIALFKQFSKKARQQAAENFAATLSDREKELFWSEVFNENTSKDFKKQYKKEKKKKGVSKDPFDQAI